MQIMRLVLLIAASTCLAGCATPSRGPAQVRVTNDEVAAYVRAHWSDYARQAAQLSPRNGAEAVLVSLGDSKCDDYFGVAMCQIAATLRFGEETVEHRFWSTFDRTVEGSLEEVIILVHERSEPIP